MKLLTLCTGAATTGTARILALLRWLALALVLVGAASPALAAKTYSDNGDGTVTDPTTGLTWMRCSMGQTWDGACTGTASTYTFAQANALTGALTFAGQSDWRVPSIRELQTIVDRTVYNPAIDSVVFPATQSSIFWSGSPYTGNSGRGWTVNFSNGIADYDFGQNSLSNVRMVRGGQSVGLLDSNRPTTDYIDLGNGSVTHSPTRLTWQRCAVGQSWADSTCSGSPSLFAWNEAKLLKSSFAGQSDWRLPTEEELVSLVEYNKFSPAIDATLFPNTSFSFFGRVRPLLTIRAGRGTCI